MNRVRWMGLGLVATALAACGGTPAGGAGPGRASHATTSSAGAGTGSREIRSETRTVEPFERIQVSGIVELSVTLGGPLSVTVETDENLLSSVRTETRSKTLYVDTTGDLRPSKSIRVAVTAPVLEDLRVSGTVAAVVSGRVQEGTDFNCDATGTSSLELPGVRARALDVALSGTARLRAQDVVCQEFHLVIAGTGAADATGTAEEVRLDIDGTGRADLSRLAAKEVHATLNGTASAEVNVSTSLTVRATGASRLVYTGNPTRVDKAAAAPSEVRQK